MKKLFSIQYSDNGISFAALVLRLAMGSMMLPHGFSKLLNFAVMSQKFSDPFHLGHTVSLCLVIFAELFCPVFIILGLLTRLACIPLLISLTVALWYAHHWQIFGAGERAALYLAGIIAILFIGAGKISLDRLIGK
ncbi:MAG TPA: DoxX family protein [Chitinophagaceae bacterium]|jgi:putative oxidoreductase|nr:DoxX family protein [Chitinophagaceae bacterium]